MARSVRDTYERMAPFYDLLDWPYEVARYRRVRPLLFAGLAGRLLDAGVGTGRSIPFYPPGSDVIGIDLSPAMLARARRRGARALRPPRLLCMDVTRLAFADASFDAAVASFLFCVLPDRAVVPALREIARVLKPEGMVRALDFVRPRLGRRAMLARFWEPWMRWAFAAGFDRLMEADIEAAGLEVAAADMVVPDRIRLLTVRHRGLPARQG